MSNPIYAKVEQAEEGMAKAMLAEEEFADTPAIANATPIQKKKASDVIPVQRSGAHPPPFGLPEGGIWGTNTYHGGQTSGTSALCCVCCGGIAACIVCCHPFDKRRAYMVKGKVYDANGVYIGGPDMFEDEEFDGPVNTEKKTNALLISGSVGTLFFIMYLVAQLSSGTARALEVIRGAERNAP